MKGAAYEALKIETLAARLGDVAALRDVLGDPKGWRVREVGDGNLNLVFIVESDKSGLVVKQALPYVRLVGESWPLPLKRSFFEYHTLIRQAARDPGRVPEVLHFDEAQSVIVMEFLTPHLILRRALIQGRILPKIGKDLGLFVARTLFRGSDLAMEARQRKADLALFADNVELCDITENLVFSDPYFEAELNAHTSPELDPIVAELRADRDMKVTAQRMKHLFATKAETLVHGDLHTGSIMVTDDDTRVIDPEFAFYGPMAFDVGMLFANFWMAFFSQDGHEADGERDLMRTFLLDTVEECWSVFCAEFSRLWHTERTGILYQRSLFEDRGDALGAEQALDEVLHDIWVDLLGFAGVEVHRRILGLAHNADFETIEDRATRAACETKALKFGRHIAVNRAAVQGLSQVRALAERLQSGVIA
ncbi:MULTISPECIES: S-methyl-5-thioribose kinase [Mesorhizobium]|uniref:S-methyl-5-thioribose kinase n=1 Tax=Mesorhizobium denitrificans TaxID=2294114 RepID=A0A371XIG1_9HYPH|nr:MULTISPECIES: S-methyl-5-thioribose kinase [Mesorhizobium]RFC69003.1 S-methyl-5-thioribose kinase [Mesorhizobium denitrificans]